MPDPAEDKTTLHRDMAREARRLSEARQPDGIGLLWSSTSPQVREDLSAIFHLLDRYAETLDALMEKHPNLVLGTWAENSNC